MRLGVAGILAWSAVGTTSSLRLCTATALSVLVPHDALATTTRYSKLCQLSDPVSFPGEAR